MKDILYGQYCGRMRAMRVRPLPKHEWARVFRTSLERSR